MRAFYTLMLIVTTALSVVGALFSGVIVRLFAPKLPVEALEFSGTLLAVMFPMMIFTGLSYTLVAVSQSNGKFIFPALISSASNIFIIAYLLFFARNTADGISVLSLVYTVSSVIQLLTVWIPLKVKGLSPGLSFSFSSPYLKKALSNTAFIVLGSWLTPALSLISNFFLSFRAPSSLVTFDCAGTLAFMASGVIVYGFCNYAFPELSKKANDTNAFYGVVSKAMKRMLPPVLILSVIVYLLSDEAVRIIYTRDSFSSSAGLQTRNF